jgi:hypothetical protein
LARPANVWHLALATIIRLHLSQHYFHIIHCNIIIYFHCLFSLLLSHGFQ